MRNVSRYLIDYATGNDNNLNLLRFVAASLVLYSHCFPLALGWGASDPIASISGISLGEIAVDVFFIISGFLIAASFYSRNNLWVFIWSRVLRIYPALVVAVSFCVFVVGASFTEVGLREYFLDPETTRFLVKNSTLVFGVEYVLPGVFESAPCKYSVNGSLWTLPYEILMYVVLACALTLLNYVDKQRNRNLTKCIIGVVSSFAVCLHVANHFMDFFPAELLRLFSMFFIGCAFFLWRERICISSKWTIFSIILLAASLMNNDLFVVVYTLTLPFILFFLAYIPSGRIRKYNQCGDYSYGMYIYAYPVQQSVVELFPGISVIGVFVASFLVTLFLSVISWHLVEQRFLKLKKYMSQKFHSKPLAN
jgi:peptidoglycan/LPS O-acetylase OafA/YrhL